MTPEQTIRAIIIGRAKENGFEFEEDASVVTDENVDDLYVELEDKDEHWEYLSELREGDEETNIPCEWSRHYESKSVAAKTPDGKWIGWTYWYGGGKHGNPEEIDWISGAYLLNATEEEKVVVVRTFEKQKEQE